MKESLLYALAAALLTALAVHGDSAHAEAPDAGINVERVQTADLDLGSEAGRKTLDRRLARAAVRVCGEASSFDLRGRKDVRSCRAEVRAKAGAQRALARRGSARAGELTVLAIR